MALNPVQTAYNYIAAAQDKKKAERGLKALGDTSFRATPDTLRYRDQTIRDINNPQGLTAGERGSYMNDIAGANLVSLNKATGIGGGNTFRTASLFSNLPIFSAYDRIAGMDASRRFGNQQSAIGRYGNVVGMMQNNADKNAMLKQQAASAYGMAIKDARLNKRSALNEFATDWTKLGLNAAGAYLGMPNLGQGIGTGKQKPVLTTNPDVPEAGMSESAQSFNPSMLGEGNVTSFF